MTSFIFSAIRKAIARVASVSLLDVSKNIEPSALKLRAITSSAYEVPRIQCRQILPSTAASSIPASLPSSSVTAPRAATPIHSHVRATSAPTPYSTSYSLRNAQKPSVLASIDTSSPSPSRPDCRLNMHTIIIGGSVHTRVFRGVDMSLAVVRVATTGLSFRRPMLKHVVKGISHHRFIPNQFDRRKAPARLLFPSSCPDTTNDTSSAIKSAMKTAIFGSNENRRFKAIDLGLATARAATMTMSFRSPAMKFATRAVLHPRLLPNSLDRRRGIAQRFLQERR